MEFESNCKLHNRESQLYFQRNAIYLCWSKRLWHHLTLDCTLLIFVHSSSGPCPPLSGRKETDRVFLFLLSIDKDKKVEERSPILHLLHLLLALCNLLVLKRILILLGELLRIPTFWTPPKCFVFFMPFIRICTFQ